MRLSGALAIVVAIACVPRSSAAEPGIGVAVTGDNELKVSVANHVQRWLAHRGFTTVAMPMNAEAIDATATCLIAGDPRCARTVVEAHSTTDNVVYARVDVAPQTNDVTLNAYWFVRGHEAVAERRVCEHCQGSAWGDVVDRMMDALATGSSQMGKLDLRSRPPGLTALIDNHEVGVTPLEVDLPAGKHALTLTSGSDTMAHREVTVAGGNTTRLTVKAQLPTTTSTTTTTSVDVETGHASRLVPLLLLGAGLGAVGTGIGLIYVGQQNGPETKWLHPDDTPIGIGLVTAGTGMLAGGLVTLLRAGHGSASTPIAGISRHGAYLGWQARF